MAPPLAIDREVKYNDDLLTSTPMNYGKARPLAFVADEKIYVIGSTIQDLEGDRIPYFEMFDPKVRKWSVLENPPEINVNTIWVGHAVVGRKALLVGRRREKKHLYCFDLDTCEWASISIPDYAGNFSGNTEFVGNTFYGCYYDTVAAIAPDELKEEEAEEKDFQQMFKHHRLFQVSRDLGMDAIFNVPPQLQYSSSLLHLGNMYFCYVRTGMPPHQDPILASDLVIGDDKKRFISIVIFQAIGKTCDSRFFRAKFLHSEHYVVDSRFPNDGFIRGCYVFGSVYFSWPFHLRLNTFIFFVSTFHMNTSVVSWDLVVLDLSFSTHKTKPRMMVINSNPNIPFLHRTLKTHYLCKTGIHRVKLTDQCLRWSCQQCWGEDVQASFQFQGQPQSCHFSLFVTIFFFLKKKFYWVEFFY